MKDTDLFIDTDEGTIPLNSPAKRNSFMDTPSKLVGTIILLILLVVVILYFKSGRIQSSVRQENSNATQVTATEQPSHPVPGARPGQIEGDIACPPGIATIVYTNLRPEMKISLNYRTTSPGVEYIKRYNGSEYSKVTNSASALPVAVPPSKTETATAKTSTVASSMDVTVPVGQRFSDLTIHWRLSIRK
jgi:hypothetical protein